MPAKFLALAEQYGLSDDLSGFVLRKGVSTLREWQADPAISGSR